MERKAGLYAEKGSAWERTKPEEIKATTDMVKSITEMVEAMQANPQATSNLEGIKQVFEQPLTDFRQALFNPLLEGIYENVSPLIAEAMPVIEDFSRIVGPVLTPVITMLSEVLRLVTPVLNWVADFMENAMGGLFDLDITKWQQPGYDMGTALAEGGMGAAGGAATGALVGGLIGGLPGAAIGALIGGIAGFFTGFIA